MRIVAVLIVLGLLGAALPAAAKTRVAPARPDGPKEIGRFEDWQAATHSEAGVLVCYAFARAVSSAPRIPGRGDVVLTVTQRPSGRDAVAISAGFVYAAGSEVTVQVDQVALSFYTAQRNTFARDGAAAVAAFLRGRTAIARSPGPRGASVIDSFSLRGFGAAYAAIGRACPAH